MHVLHNIIKEYAWGSHVALPAFLGRASPSATPQAELWVGAHPLGNSQLLCGGELMPLGAYIARRPEAVGPGWRGLPFLLKVLAIQKPLSLQAHPNAAQARQGHREEEALHLPQEARNYKDANHKPELLCALTPFEALVGFEAPARLLQLFEALALPSLQEAVALLRQADEALALRGFFERLLRWPKAQRPALLAQARLGLLRMAEAAEAGAEAGAEGVKAGGAAFAQKAALALRLLGEYPEDMGILGSLCLNLICLEPLEALYIPAGCLHAYTRGMGVEIMANSDNVLRGGLSPKRVDIEALLSVLCFERFIPHIQKALPQAGEEHVFEAPVSEFCLSLLRVSPSAPCAPRRCGAELLLVVEGELAAQGPEGVLRLGRGHAAFVAADEGPYILMGEGLVARAQVGAPSHSGK